MMRFFDIDFSEKAYERDNAPVAKTRNRDKQEYLTPTSKVDVFEFDVDAEPLDYLANDFAWRLTSQKMKDAICEHIDDDSIVWFPVRVYFKDKQYLYYYPVFSNELGLDVLDMSRSICVDDFVVKAVYLTEKINHLKAFTKPGGSEITFIVNEDIKKHLVKIKITGVEFSPCRVT